MNSSRGCREKSYSSHKREEFGSRGNQGASHHGGGHGNQNYTGNSRPTNADRIHWAFLSCIGKKVVVQLKDGQCWEGIFHVSNIISSTAEPSVMSSYNKRYGIVLKMAHKLPKGDKPETQQPCPVLAIADNEFESMRVVMTDASWGPSGNTFLTDSEITKSNVYPENRKLQSCECLLDKDDSIVGTLEEISEANSDSKPFDQFEVNRRKFGVLSTFNESIYAAPLDKESEFYKANEASAEKVAREIESASTKNAHVAEERGQKVEEDCEEKYSSSQPQHFKSRNANNSATYDNTKITSNRNSAHSNTFNRYNTTNSLYSNTKQSVESAKRPSDQTQQATSDVSWKKESSEKPKSSHDFNHRNYDKSKPHSSSNPSRQAYTLNNPGESANGAKSTSNSGENKNTSNDSNASGSNTSHNTGSNASADSKRPNVQNTKKKLNPNAAEFRYGAGVLGLIDTANQNCLSEMQALSMQPYFAQSQAFNSSHAAMPWIQSRSASIPSLPQPAHAYANIIVPTSLEKAVTESVDAQPKTSWKDKLSVANLKPLCEIYDHALEKIMYYHMIIQESWNEQTQPLIGNFKPFTGYYDSQYLQSPYVQCYPQGPYYDYYKVGGMHRQC
ncbi:ataxin-2 homolog [Schistocerca gregaria]|uniref:ataxin-2 homolog n=1 Tax=Schistocerca gregaria TaxID=7010 RepID=UPI00211DBB8D|nr:ataxin-2 homolog [Schistocerca gregaria]